MTKKVILGVLLVGLIGVLVAGAIIRTVDKTGNVAEARGQGQGHGTLEVAGQGAGGARAGIAAGSDAGTAALPVAPGVGQAKVDEWLTLEGVATSVDADTLIVKMDDGQEVTVENRPWWFAQEQGFAAQAGDRVRLVGFYEDGTFEVGQIADSTNGMAVQIREESGRPLWAGRGRRGL